jgi:phosphoglycerol geranylgeranyltransferase
MKKILNSLVEGAAAKQKRLAILIDPDKVSADVSLLRLIHLAVENKVDYFFVGGSLLTQDNLHVVVRELKSESNIPVILFPGNSMQIDFQADAILFLSLISGRNPDLLIGQHVLAAPLLKKGNLEVWPTAYMLIESGAMTTVQYMSNSAPIPADKPVVAACTAMAGEMLGLQLVYMDAGSGAKFPINDRMIRKVKESIECPLIVGGGINSAAKAKQAWQAGADIVVVGNGVEENPDLITELADQLAEWNSVLDKKR